MKYRLLQTLRRLRLLGLADGCRFLSRWLAAIPANRRFRAAHPEFAAPPARLLHDTFNHLEWELFHESGKLHARMFCDFIGRHAPDGDLVALEWGCGPGRIVRHMREAGAGRRLALHASDVEAESVAWCRANLPGIAFTQNLAVPPLAYPAGFFDVIYCFSVVTHLSEERQLLWSAELERVLKPGGILILTTHGDQHLHLLSTAERVRYAAGEVVIQSGYAEGRKWFLALHPPRFVRERLLREFEDLQHYPSPAEYQEAQEVWVARKRRP